MGMRNSDCILKTLSILLTMRSWSWVSLCESFSRQHVRTITPLSSLTNMLPMDDKLQPWRFSRLSRMGRKRPWAQWQLGQSLRSSTLRPISIMRLVTILTWYGAWEPLIISLLSRYLFLLEKRGFTCWHTLVGQIGASVSKALVP